MDIFLHFFYKIVAKTYSKMHQIAPFLKRIIGRTYPRTLLALKYLHFSKINLNPPPPPRNQKILDTPLQTPIWHKKFQHLCIVNIQLVLYHCTWITLYDTQENY